MTASDHGGGLLPPPCRKYGENQVSMFKGHWVN
jgi:hypothetical protein